MKSLFRILIVATCFVILYVYTDDSPNENNLLEGPNQTTQPIPKEDIQQQMDSEKLPRPTTGVSLYIGQSSNTVTATFGLPNRIDQSPYSFEWWIYYTEKGLLMFSIDNDIVNQVYTNSSELTVGPYSIGQSIDDIYRMTILEYEISVQIDENIYLFSMSEADMKNRLLIEFDGVFAQLYIDEKEKTLYAIRYLDGRSLVIQKPYEMQYIGELIGEQTISSFKQITVNEAESKQLNDLTNAIRKQYGLQTLAVSPILNELSVAHSEDMFMEKSVSHDSPTYGSLKERLDANDYEYAQAGENIATGYYDSIEVIHGWLNSTDHREDMLSEKYTDIGAGAYIGYYTQIFVQNKNRQNVQY